MVAEIIEGDIKNREHYGTRRINLPLLPSGSDGV